MYITNDVGGNNINNIENIPMINFKVL